MSADFSIRPMGGPVAAPVIEPAPGAARHAVPTHLPAGKAVVATEPALSARNDPRADDSRLSRQVAIDRDAAAIVYKVVDGPSGYVVRQYPDQARLRTLAYLRAQDLARQSDARRDNGEHTDVTA
jgi:hypothetical protein